MADDHQILRDGVRWMLSDEPDVEIVGEVSDGQQLLDHLRDHSGTVDVVLLDLRMPGLGGLSALGRLHDHAAAHDTPAVLVLSMHGEPSLVRRAIELGAAGYLLKNTTREELLDAIRHVAAGHSYLQPEITGPLLDQVSGRSDLLALPTLTEREHGVLCLVADGLSNRQVAEQLGITEETVKSHLRAILIRLGVANRTEAVSAALRLGLLPGA